MGQGCRRVALLNFCVGTAGPFDRGGNEYAARRFPSCWKMKEAAVATVVERRSDQRSGLIIAMGVIVALVALVAVNFSYNHHGPGPDYQAPAPASPAH